MQCYICEQDPFVPDSLFLAYSYCILYSGKRKKSHYFISVFGHWFAFKNEVIAELIDLRSIQHNTKHTIALCLAKVSLSTLCCVVFVKAFPHSSYFQSSPNEIDLSTKEWAQKAASVRSSAWRPLLCCLLAPPCRAECHSHILVKWKRFAQKVREALTYLRQFLVMLGLIWGWLFF